MAKTRCPDRNCWILMATVLMLGMVSLIQPGCGGDPSFPFVPSSPTTLPPAITAVFPLQDSDTALVSTLVSATFTDDMNAATIDATTFTLTLGSVAVPAAVSYDATSQTATLTPAADLVSDTEYRATISASVENASGDQPLTADYVWSFTISPATLLVSKNSGAFVGNDTSAVSAIDATGRFVVFESRATNLVSAFTTLNRNHIYRKDTVTGAVALVSSDAAGLEANNSCSSPRISDNGRYVVFESTATNLDPVLTSGGTSQIYLKDLADGSIELVSRSAALVPDNSFTGARNADVSNDGRYIVFESSDNDLSLLDGGGTTQIYLKDMTDESVHMISRTSTNVPGDGPSSNAYMSPDGKYIVFESEASNLTGTNLLRHIYFVDTSAGHTVELISVDASGTEATAGSSNPSVSNDGSIVVFDTLAVLDARDTNGASDVYYRDRLTPLTGLVSANPLTRNSANAASGHAHINGDGKFVVFASLASDLVTEGVLGVKDIFVRDLSDNPGITVEKVNIPEAGGDATSDSNRPMISSDGRYVSYDSLHPFTLEDTSSLNDVYRVHNSTF